ncbi:aminotransferase class III-fold pyridoxal phosphate-dependent enzyme [Rubritalea tangerina]
MGNVVAWATQEGCLRVSSSVRESGPLSPFEGKGQDLYKKAKQLIPGGTQLLSKRPEMFLPDRWPSYYQSAKGAWVKDLDGRGYLDMSTSGIGSCILGTSDSYVNAKVCEAVSRGSMSTLNAPEEVALAEKLCALHPWADRVRYSRSGGESMAIAVRIARASTSKEVVLLCGYHGWSDWYLATNLTHSQGLDQLLLPGLSPAGVPKGLKGTAVPFHFNDKDGFDALMAEHSGRIAAVVMEPQRYQAPDVEFLKHIRAKVDDESAVLVFDEITSGWRKNIGGVHLLYGVNPDIAVFGKGLSNGIAFGAVVGREEVMEAAQDTFISSTYWTERIGPTAALATIDRFEQLNAPELIEKAGVRVQEIWESQLGKSSLRFSVGDRAMAPLSHMAFCYDDQALNRALKTLWCKEMLERGVLDNGSFYATCAHQEEELSHYESCVAEVVEVLEQSLREGSVYDRAGTCSHGGFRRLNS